MRIPRLVIVLFALALASTLTAVGVAAASPTTSNTTHGVTNIDLKMVHAYKPHEAPGTTDDYHCTLVNPHIKRNSYIISSQFFPGSDEVHHAALYLVPPSLAAKAERDDEVGKGWTCFGEGALPNTPLSDISQVPLLSFWAPGHGADDLPKGTGVASAGREPGDHAGPLQPARRRQAGKELTRPSHGAHLDAAAAPPPRPDARPPRHPVPGRRDRPAVQPCRVTRQPGPTLRPNGGRRDRGHRGPLWAEPVRPAGGGLDLVYVGISKSGYIDRVQAHMHLLGVSFTMVLNPGTPEAKTVLDVPNYNFHDQRSYNLAKPIAVTAGEPVQITCTYNPTLAQQLPILRKAPPHFVTWGDGSTDEMCIGLAWISHSLPDPHDAL